MAHSYNPFFGITRTFKLTLAQRFLYAFSFFGGTNSYTGDLGNANSVPGIFDYVTFFLPSLLNRLARFLMWHKKFLLGFVLFLFVVVPLLIFRFLFTCLAMILAIPAVLITHAVFLIRFLNKTYRNHALLDLCAQDNPNDEVIKMLIARGVDSSFCDNKGNTCLDLLASKTYPNLHLVRLLLKKGEFTNKENASKCLNILAIYGSAHDQMMCHYDFIHKIEIVYDMIKILLEKGAQFDKLLDFNVLNNRFAEILEQVIQKPQDYAFGILLILNAPIDKIKHLGKSDGNLIEKLIHHLSISKNLKEDLEQLQRHFDDKNIKEIQNMPIKEFCSEFIPKLSNNEETAIYALLWSGRKMQNEEYERIDTNTNPLPKLPITIWGEIAKRMVNKDSPAILFEVDAEDICKKMMM